MCSLPSYLYRPPLQTVDSSGYNDKSQQKQKQADGELKLSMTKLPEMQKKWLCINTEQKLHTNILS
jgi:hypothetical protein